MPCFEICCKCAYWCSSAPLPSSSLFRCVFFFLREFSSSSSFSVLLLRDSKVFCSSWIITVRSTGGIWAIVLLCTGTAKPLQCNTARQPVWGRKISPLHSDCSFSPCLIYIKPWAKVNGEKIMMMWFQDSLQISSQHPPSHVFLPPVSEDVSCSSLLSYHSGVEKDWTENMGETSPGSIWGNKTWFNPSSSFRLKASDLLHLHFSYLCLLELFLQMAVLFLQTRTVCFQLLIFLTQGLVLEFNLFQLSLASKRVVGSSEKQRAQKDELCKRE